MDADSFRFRPPDFPAPPAVGWILARAFASVAGVLAPGAESGECLRWARALGLSGRIAARAGEARLREELGDETARAFTADSHRNAVQTLLGERTLRTLSKVAAGLPGPAILLKGSALIVGGFVAPGSRGLVDVDLLVPPRAAGTLMERLAPEGFGPVVPALRMRLHHLPPLVHPQMATVEIHTRLPGVAVRKGAPARAEELMGAGLCRTFDGWPGLLTGTPALLAAHALAHALVQHGSAPFAYPITRMAADLLDLAGGGSGIERLMAEARPLLQASLSERELRAAASLCVQLAAGASLSTAGDAGLLMAHCLAGIEDLHYNRSLRARVLSDMLKPRRWGDLLAWLVYSLRAPAESLHGPPRSGADSVRAWPRRLAARLRYLGRVAHSWRVRSGGTSRPRSTL